MNPNNQKPENLEFTLYSLHVVSTNQKIANE